MIVVFEYRWDHSLYSVLSNNPEDNGVAFEVGLEEIYGTCHKVDSGVLLGKMMTERFFPDIEVKRCDRPWYESAAAQKRF